MVDHVGVEVAFILAPFGGVREQLTHTEVRENNLISWLYDTTQC
jgi:hypothetical protein